MEKIDLKMLMQAMCYYPEYASLASKIDSKDTARLLGILGRHVAPLEVVHDLFPQFVVLVRHTKRKQIQSNVALLLFGAVALYAVTSEKFVFDRRFGPCLLRNRLFLAGIREHGLGSHLRLSLDHADYTDK